MKTHGRQGRYPNYSDLIKLVEEEEEDTNL